MEISEELEQELLAQLKALREEELAQANVIRDLKTAKADRQALLPEVDKLSQIKARVADVNRQLYPPDKLEINKAGLEDLLKRRAFFFPSFSIHGGSSGFYDFGPAGCAIKANLLALWRQMFILEDNIHEIDTACITPYQVLETSGHIEKFQDLMVKDALTGTCHRADHLLEDRMDQLLADPAVTDAQLAEYSQIKAAAGNMSAAELDVYLAKYNAKAPETGNDITAAYEFNLMFATQIGPSGQHVGFLRPETAQGIFVNFARLLDYNNGKLPMAAATIGLAFRNEISPRNGLLRVREFALAEIEHFVDPEDKTHPKFDDIRDQELLLYTKQAQVGSRRLIKMKIGDAVAQGIIDNQTLGYYMARINCFLTTAGVRRLRFRQHKEKEMAHYAKDCWDAEILTSFGWVECVGVADRSCYDLTAHSTRTGARLTAFREYPDGPRVIEYTEAKLNKGLIGGSFKKDAALVFAWFENATEQELLEVKAALEASGEVTITSKTCEGKQFVVTSKMVTLQPATRKESGRQITPGVIEPSFGIGRIIYSIFEHSYYVRQDDEKRGVLSFPPSIAPVKCSVLPLIVNADLQKFVSEIVRILTAANISYKVDDVGQSIGRRYARTDEIGIPFGITIDFQTIQDHTVTLRERDSTLQVRIPTSRLAEVLTNLCQGRLTWEAVRAEFPHVEPVAE